jgi:hypothetical protein
MDNLDFAYDEDWMPVVKIEEGTSAVQAGNFYSLQ